MDSGVRRGQQVLDQALVAQRQGVVEEPGLAGLEQTGQGDGRPHIGQGIVGAAVLDAIGGGESLQSEGGDAIVAGRPLDALGAQGMGRRRVSMRSQRELPFCHSRRIGVAQVAVEEVAGDLVVEADAVVADPAGPWATQFAGDVGGEFGLRQAAFGGHLGGEAGDQARLGLGQQVVGGAGVNAPAGRLPD